MIVGCGDSFIYGSDLHDASTEYSKITYPGRFAEHMRQNVGVHANYKCYAEAGCGNHRILNQIISAMRRFGSSVYYVINWTWIDRFDYYDSESTCWKTCRPSLDENPYADQCYYKHFHSDLYEKHKTLGHIDHAIQLLTKANCGFLMTYMDYHILDTDHNVDHNMRILQKRVKPYLSTFDGMNFLDWSKNKKFKISKKMHPLEDAHFAAYQYFLPKYEQWCWGTKYHTKEDITNASI